MVVERHVNINKLVGSSGNILLEQFLIEHRKQSKIALILLYFDLWLVQRTRSTLNQSDVKLKAISTWSPVFPRFRQFNCFYFEFSLALKVFSVLLIDCLYFGFGFTILDQESALEVVLSVTKSLIYFLELQVNCPISGPDSIIQTDALRLPNQWWSEGETQTAYTGV